MTLEAERLITEARSSLEELASHLRDLTVAPLAAPFAHRFPSGSKARIEWTTLTRTVGWKPGPGGFCTGVFPAGVVQGDMSHGPHN
ncbi:MAG: hypothetical protein ACREQM_11255 [Candidatus Dormibacteraceae bacterium]